jgi:hypothetical protein
MATIGINGPKGSLFGILFLGVIALFKGARSIDKDIRDERDLLKSELEKRGRADKFHIELARKRLGIVSNDGLEVLRLLFRHDKLVKSQFPTKATFDPQRLETLLEELAEIELVRKLNMDVSGVGPRPCWEIVPGFMPALGELLFTNEQEGSV